MNARIFSMIAITALAAVSVGATNVAADVSDMVEPGNGIHVETNIVGPGGDCTGLVDVLCTHSVCHASWNGDCSSWRDNHCIVWLFNSYNCFLENPL